jgi:hypothetical protein
MMQDPNSTPLSGRFNAQAIPVFQPKIHLSPHFKLTHYRRLTPEHNMNYVPLSFKWEH